MEMEMEKNTSVYVSRVKHLPLGPDGHAAFVIASGVGMEPFTPQISGASRCQLKHAREARLRHAIRTLDSKADRSWYGG